MCYAESDDGLHFDVPDIGLVNIGMPNNIVFPLEPSLFEPSCVSMVNGFRSLQAGGITPSSSSPHLPSCFRA